MSPSERRLIQSAATGPAGFADGTPLRPCRTPDPARPATPPSPRPVRDDLGGPASPQPGPSVPVDDPTTPSPIGLDGTPDHPAQRRPSDRPDTGRPCPPRSPRRAPCCRGRPRKRSLRAPAWRQTPSRRSRPRLRVRWGGAPGRPVPSTRTGMGAAARPAREVRREAEPRHRADRPSPRRSVWSLPGQVPRNGVAADDRLAGATVTGPASASRSSTASGHRGAWLE